MLAEELNIDDLKDMDAELHKGLMAYMDTPLAELGMDDMTFTTEVHYFGKTEITELKPGGTSIQVLSLFMFPPVFLSTLLEA
jgi:E3 ubiquitin-protein ligase NEDD4